MSWICQRALTEGTAEGKLLRKSEARSAEELQRRGH